MKFKDVAHLYLGCNLLEEGFGVVFFDGILFHQEITSDSPFELYKPILRRLDLTKSDGGVDEWLLVELFGDEENAIEHEDVYESVFKLQLGHPEMWLRLLQEGYDLFGLIDAGEAIDANTLEEQK